jgi:hypothetical protein
VLRKLAVDIRDRVDKGEAVFGHLAVEGRLTPTEIRYRPNDVLEIRRLPGAPNYIRIDPDAVRLGPGDGARLEESEEADFYRLYRCFDARRLGITIDEAEEVAISPTEIAARFTLARVALVEILAVAGYGPPAVDDRLGRLRRLVPAIERPRGVRFNVEDNRLLGFSLLDLTRDPVLLTVALSKGPLIDQGLA